jgi:alanyl-tRNA synthetase
VADASGAGNLLEPDVLVRVELRVNQVVAEARPVRVTFEDAAAVTDLRKPSDRDGVLRIVTIEGIDRSACGGTHVKTTAAIGPVLLRRQERVRQGLRIEFVCGERAIRRARRDHESLTRIGRLFSASIDEAAKLVEGQAAQLVDLQNENRRQAESLATYRAAELHAAATPRDDGLRFVVARVHAGADTARSLALAFAPLSRAVFVAASHAPPSVLMATSADSGVDAGKTLRPLLERVGGRGGGSPRLAQGSAPSSAAVDQVVAWITSGAPST